MLATGLGVPSELYVAEIGPALRLASQIIISLTFEPPEVLEVNKSKAILATTVPEVVWLQVHVALRRKRRNER